MNKKWLQIKSCECGCGVTIKKYGSNRQIRRFVKGHQRTWLGKKRLSMVGNTFGFKKGIAPWNKGMEYNQIKGEKHFAWKGNKVGYEALHTWIYRNLGKPTQCEFCGRDGLSGKYIHWANKSRKYLRTLSDWLRLCAKCHWKYDRGKKS